MAILSIAPHAVKISREEDGDEGEYAVVRALGFKVRCLPRGYTQCSMRMIVVCAKQTVHAPASQDRNAICYICM